MILLAALQLLQLLSFGAEVASLGRPSYVETTCTGPSGHGCFTIASKDPKVVAAIYVDDGLEEPGVLRAVGDLQTDIGRVTSQTPRVVGNGNATAGAPTIIVGTLGRSALLAELVRRGRVDPAPLAGAWEAFVIQTVAHPLPGLASALVIAGSDKRGTIFGVYDLAEQMGVSPWHWWADVPVARRGSLYVQPSTHVLQGPPTVKYRGICKWSAACRAPCRAPATCMHSAAAQPGLRTRTRVGVLSVVRACCSTRVLEECARVV